MNGPHSASAQTQSKVARISFTPAGVLLCQGAWTLDHLAEQLILDTRYFEIFEPAPTNDAYGGMLAANHATAKLIIEMAKWLDDVVKQSVKPKE
jgi:hypothetical protein